MNKFFLFFLCLFCLTSTYLFAVPAIPYPVEVTQPDGSVLTIRLHGDERLNYITTEDGYMITKNQQDFYVFATVSQSGEMEATAHIARNSDERNATDARFLKSLDVQAEIERYYNAESVSPKQMQRAAMQQAAQDQPQRTPKTGSPKFIVLLVEFSDRQFVNRTTAQTRYSNLLNQQGYSTNGSTGCVKDYYTANSYGQFTPNFVVVGPVTVPNTAQYYCSNDGARVPQLVVDACTAADAIVDFSEYDNDGDSRVDNVLCFVAGWDRAQGGADATNVWSHRYVVSASNSFDSKRVYDYFVTSELKGSSGSNMVNIGTFVHEFGHILGLPDYYHTTTSTKNTLNNWSPMDSGSYCNDSRTPPMFSAYDRFFLGWLTPEQYTSGQKTLYPLSQSGTAAQAGQAYLVAASTHNLNGASPNPSQFFVIEYREKTGWDAYLGTGTTSGTSGMLIWHIDYSSTAWNNNSVNNYSGTTQTASSHMRVYLRPTNGGNTTTPGGAFTSGSFTPALWNGSTTGLPQITNITKNGSTNMTFGGATVDPPKAPTAFTVIPDEGGALSAALQWTNPTQTMSGAAVTLTKVEVQRDGALIYTNNTPAAGAVATYTDNSPSNGLHIYTVYAYNSDGVSAAATASAFVGVDPCTILTYPWTEGFNGETSTPYRPNNCWEVKSYSSSGTESASFHWKQVTAYVDQTFPQYLTPQEGTAMLLYNCWDYAVNAKGRLITPLMSVKNKALKFSFYIYRDAMGPYTAKADSVNIYLSPTKNITDATRLRTVYRHRSTPSLTTPTEAANGWYRYENELPTTELSFAYVIIEAVSQNGNNIYLDNIRVAEIIPCQKPVATLGGTSTTTAKLTWTGSASNYEIEWGAKNFTPGTGAKIGSAVVNASPYTISGLNVNTAYDAYIRANCDSDNASDWVKVSFTTDIPSVDTSVTLTDGTLTANQSGASYRWLDCDNDNAPIASAVFQSFTPTKTGSYAVEITYEGYVFVSECTTVTITGIGMEKRNNIIIFPNPAKDVVYINLQSIGSQAKLTITDISGRIKDTFSISGDENRLPINVSSYPVGMYVLRVVSNEGGFVERLVIRR